MLGRIQTRDLCLWYHIELHAPTNSDGEGLQISYTSAATVDNVICKDVIFHFYSLQLEETQTCSSAALLIVLDSLNHLLDGYIVIRA